MPRHDDDDEDDRPRPRKRPRPDDDEDDRPKARPKASRDDDEDDRPKARPKASRDDDEDDDRPRRRRIYQDDDEYDDRPRKRTKKRKKSGQVSVPGAVALVIGLAGVALSFACGGIAIAPAVIGLGFGIFGVFFDRKNEQSPILSLSGLVVSLVALGLSVYFLVSFGKKVNDIRKDFKEGMEQAAKEQAERKAEQAKAADEVKAAEPGTVLQVSAVQFYKAYDTDPDGADLLYKNKIIELTGTVDESDTDRASETYTVWLKGGPAEGDTVDCEFAKNADVRAKLRQLRKGQTVRIRGKCLGGGSTLEGCILVP